MKRLLLFLSLITFKSNKTMEGVAVADPNQKIVLALTAVTSPRCGIGITASGSPRKNLQQLQERGERPLHPLLVRAESERRLLDLIASKDEEELKKINDADQYQKGKLPRRNSGSSPLSSNSELVTKQTESSETTVSCVTYRRNTIAY